LEVFTAREKEFFFRRKRLTEDIQQKLQEYRFIPLISLSAIGRGEFRVIYLGKQRKGNSSKFIAGGKINRGILEI
jgi:hypothetical protein